MVVTFESSFALPLDGEHLKLMDKKWYDALDPNSYNLTDDAEGFGVYWCKTEGCNNYYRFSHSRLKRLLKPSDYTRRSAGSKPVVASHTLESADQQLEIDGPRKPKFKLPPTFFTNF